MAAYTGPSNNITGQVVKTPYGQPCDAHPDRLAEVRIVKESNEHGSTLIDLCSECFKDYLQDRRDDQEGMAHCEVCGAYTDTCISWKDPTEGYDGKFRNVCHECRRLKEEEYIESLESTAEDQDEPPYILESDFDEIDED